MIEQHRYQIVLYKGNWLEEKERLVNSLLGLYKRAMKKRKNLKPDKIF